MSVSRHRFGEICINSMFLSSRPDWTAVVNFNWLCNPATGFVYEGIDYPHCLHLGAGAVELGKDSLG